MIYVSFEASDCNIQSLGGAPIGEPAAEIVVLGHRDLRMAELVGDLPSGQLRLVQDGAQVLRNT